MSTSESRSGLVMDLAEEFLDRYRRGERPGLKEYMDRHPELSDEIREVFPAMAMMENIAISEESPPDATTRADLGAGSKTAVPQPEQLGDYRIIREIGHGGMGVVYEAEQLSLGRHVALKVLPPLMMRDHKQRQRFEREAKSAAKLHHTNIVPVFGVGEHEGMAYYVMQHIQGLGIDDVIDELKRLRPRGIGSQDHGPTGQSRTALPSGLPQSGPTAAAVADLTAADVARSLLTGCLEAGGTADSTSSEPIADTVPDDAASTRAHSPGGQAAGDHGNGSGVVVGDRAESHFGSESSISLPGTSRDGRSGGSRARRATYWQSVAQVGVQVADALEYAHKQGVVHRDIKPSNLLLDGRGTVWVTDFGLAKADDQQNLTHTGDILGTLRYMPPEAFEGGADARGDIYSLGMTLYEMLAFRPAFDQKERGRLVREVTTGEPPRLAKLAVKVPVDLETIIHKAIDRDPGHRYQTAAALAADLQRFLDDEPIQARRVSLPERLNRWRRRNRSLAAAVMTIAAVLFLGSVVSTLLMIRANRYAADAERESKRATIAARSAETASEQSRKAAESEAAAARIARAESARQAAARGLALIELHDQGRGLAWLARTLALDPEDASGVHHAVRVNLAQVLDEEMAEPRLMLDPGTTAPSANGHPRHEVVNCLQFSPDGAVIAVGYFGAVRLWSLADGRLLGKPLAPPDGVNCVAFSPDSRQLRIGGRRGAVSTWDVANGLAVGKPVAFPGPVVEITPDGRIVVVAQGAQQFVAIDATTLKPLGPPLLNLRHRSQGPSRAALSPDRKYLLTGESNDTPGGISRAGLVWDIATGRLRCETGKHDTYHIYAVAWSPDGKTVATGGHDTVLRLWDSATGAMRGLPQAMARSIADLKFSPDGRTLAVAQAWMIGDTHHDPSGVRVLDVSRGTPVGPEWRFDAKVACLEYHPDGQSLAVGLADGTTHVWSLPRGSIPRETVPLLDDPISLAASRDGLVAIGMSTDNLLLHDSRSGKTRRVMSFPGRTVWSVAFSPDGLTLAAGTGFRSTGFDTKPSGEVFLIDVKSGEPICSPIKVQEPRAHIERFSADGKVLYTKSDDGKRLKLWDAHSGDSLGKDFAGRGDVAFVSPSADDYELLVVDKQGRLTHLDLETRQPLGPPVMLHPHGVKAISIDSGGRTFATLASDSAVRLWNAAEIQPLGPPIENDGDVRRPKIHPDGKTIAIAGQGVAGSFSFWDGMSGLRLGRTPYVPGWYSSLSIFPSGEMQAVGGTGTLLIKRTPRELGGAPEEIRQTVLLRTGWTVESTGTVAQLSDAEWRRVRKEQGPVRDSLAGSSMDPSGESTSWHIARALQLGEDPFAVQWHLERALACGGDERLIRLLRARARADLGDIASAADDLEYVLPGLPQTTAAWRFFLVTAIKVSGDSRSRALRKLAYDAMQRNGIQFELDEPDGIALATEFGQDGRWQAAAAVLRPFQVDRENPGGPGLYHVDQDLMVALINAGDRDGYQALGQSISDRVAATRNDDVLFSGIFNCALAPDVLPDFAPLVKIAEKPFSSELHGAHRVLHLRPLGAALYRSGRYGDCIAKIQESIQLRGGESRAFDHAFLAMAYARKGNLAEARSWLEKLAKFDPPDSPEVLWDRWQIRLIESEARALILYDRDFPSNPFAG